jgi:hypothetical protein
MNRMGQEWRLLTGDNRENREKFSDPQIIIVFCFLRILRILRTKKILPPRLRVFVVNPILIILFILANIRIRVSLCICLTPIHSDRL